MPVLRFLFKVSDLFEVITEYVSSIFMFVVIALLFGQVLMRIFLSTVFPWTEEIARLLMIWIAMLGGSLLVKENNLISVDFLDPYIPKILLRSRKVLITLLLLWLCSILTYEGYHQAIYGKRVMLSSVRISMSVPYFAIPVGAVLMVYHYFVNMCKEKIIKGDGLI